VFREWLLVRASDTHLSIGKAAAYIAARVDVVKLRGFKDRVERGRNLGPTTRLPNSVSRSQIPRVPVEVEKDPKNASLALPAARADNKT
jgi:hypothetical protein